jgi:hypothetical protein
MPLPHSEGGRKGRRAGQASQGGASPAPTIYEIRTRLASRFMRSIVGAGLAPPCFDCLTVSRHL